MMRVNTGALKWIATDITIGSGSEFHIHMIASSPSANIDNFYFAGEALNLKDGTKVKSFVKIFGFIIKSEINSTNETFFNLPSGYSIDLLPTEFIWFGEASF